ncbi:exodeoxyribonuclease VII large subunit [compost metagenome]
MLKRGYVVVRDSADRALTRAANVAEGSAISIEFADGRVLAVAGEASGSADPGQAAPAAVPPKRKAPKPDVASGPPKQGSLF